LIVGEDIFFYSVFILLNDVVTRGDDGLGATIIFFEQDGGRVRKMIFKLQDIFNIRATPRINILIDVPDYTDIVCVTGE